MKFLVDNQLPVALAQFFRTRGLDCQHVLDAGLAEASDTEICRYARTEGRAIISKDEDFLYLSSQPTTQITLLWVRLGNCRTAALLSAFRELWPEIESSLKSGDTVIEIR